jgi:CheY-like chemotaxis protein
MTPAADRPRVLVVDDNPADVQLIAFGFDAHAVPVHLDTARDGVHAREVIAALAGSGDCPRLILLDLNMPRANGYDVLEYLAREGHCRDSAVVVLTTSDAPSDRTRCLAMGATAVITKPAHVDGLMELIRTLSPYLSPTG